MTTYVVLGYVTAPDGWTEHARVAARSNREAIRKAADKSAGKYVAIPERSFQPVTVTVETQTRITLT